MHRPTVGRYIGRLSVDYRSTIGRLSAYMSTEATYSTHDPLMLHWLVYPIKQTKRKYVWLDWCAQLIWSYSYFLTLQLINVYPLLTKWTDPLSNFFVSLLCRAYDILWEMLHPISKGCGDWACVCCKGVDVILFNHTSQHFKPTCFLIYKSSIWKSCYAIQELGKW